MSEGMMEPQTIEAVADTIRMHCFYTIDVLV